MRFARTRVAKRSRMRPGTSEFRATGCSYDRHRDRLIGHVAVTHISQNNRHPPDELGRPSRALRGAAVQGAVWAPITIHDERSHDDAGPARSIDQVDFAACGVCTLEMVRMVDIKIARTNPSIATITG
jgi:hypothetical protein